MFRDIMHWAVITIYFGRLLLWLRTLRSFYLWLDSLQCDVTPYVAKWAIDCVLLGWYGFSYIFLWDIVSIKWLADKIGYSVPLSTTVMGGCDD